jgi:hypothetical protein
MTDVRTYTASGTLPTWATAITDAIRARNLNKARSIFRAAARKNTLEDAVYAAAATVEPAPDEITVGEAPLVFGNPLRDGYAWRCGTCLHAFRRGGRSAVAGVNYTTPRGALNAARKHANEDHAGAVPVREVTR